jgi:hypothetical protein
MEELGTKHQALMVRVTSLEQSAAAASQSRVLSLDTIEQAIKKDPYVRFEVLEDWKGQFRKGSLVRADHSTHLLAYVASGLKLGVPQNQDALLAKLHAETVAMHALAENEAALARAAVARIDAQAAEIRALALKGPYPPIDAPPA